MIHDLVFAINLLGIIIFPKKLESAAFKKYFKSLVIKFIN